MSLPRKISLTGTEGKRSFPQSSFAFFSFKKRKWERRRTSLPQKISLTGVGANRSFAESSLPSFLLRKRVGGTVKPQTIQALLGDHSPEEGHPRQGGQQHAAQNIAGQQLTEAHGKGVEGVSGPEGCLLYTSRCV